MTQKPILLGQVKVIDAILNLATPLSVLDPYCSFQIYQRCLFGQPSEIYAILDLLAPLWALNPYD